MEFVEVLSNESIHVAPKEREKIESVKKRLGKDFYPKVIWTVTQKTYDPFEAKRRWESILGHKRDLNSTLGKGCGHFGSHTRLHEQHSE